jgi:hypothetical protein
MVDHGNHRWPMVALAVLVGCATPHGGPSLPAGIAELRLPADAGTLRRIATDDDAARRLERRREIRAGLNRQLLMPPPDDALVPELFDFVVALAPRLESGTMSAAWGSYLYTTYQRDLGAERPRGVPRRTTPEIETVLADWIEYYAIRETPRANRPGVASDGFEATREWRTEKRMGR